MSFDLGAVLRRTRSARTAPIRLARRDDGALTFVDALSTVGTRLLLDTTVYIDALKGEIPPDLDRLVDGRTKVHSAVAIAELVVAFGRLDPADPRTERSLRAIEDLVGAIASERVLAPTPQDVAEGAIRAGAVARATTLSDGERRKAFNDAVIAAQAARTGMILITRNLAEFDRLAQLDPRLQVAFYRRA